ncbi:SRPBCC family protein [Pedobacter sp. AW1-32]|uniref:SRPBCC family protein n=1 Tax=Pedobacter sp. AW1-32 TaxID=3383026 RepID=UPI003FEE7DD7
MAKITVQTTVNAPIEKVWTMWSEPQHITKWNQASDDWHSPHAENDLRTGGSFTTTMEAKDGSMSFDFGGTYTAVEEYRKIDYAMADGRMVSVTFTPNHDGVYIEETFDPEEINPEDMQQAGWQAILNSFKNYAEQ